MRRLRACMFLLIAILLSGAMNVLLAQEDFKGERRAPNPTVNHRTSEAKPRSGGAAKARTGKSARRSNSEGASSSGEEPVRTGRAGRGPDLSQQIETAIERGNQARDAFNYGDAEQQYRRAISLNNADWRAWYGLGNVFNDAGSYSAAIEPLQRAVSLNPDAAQAHHSLGTSYYFTERYADAIEQYKQAVSLVPDYLYAHYDLGMSYIKIHNKEAALEQYEILKRLNPGLAANFRRELR